MVLYYWQHPESFFFKTFRTFSAFLRRQKQSPDTFYEKKVFLKISQNSQGNPYARVPFQLNLQACVNFAKFLRIPFLQNTSGRLPPRGRSVKSAFLKLCQFPIFKIRCFVIRENTCYELLATS